MELFDLTGKTAVVTGSTRGIGNAIARRFAEHGANVVVCGTTLDKAVAVADQINAQEGAGRAIGQCFNLQDPEGPKALIDAAVERFGAVDVLVCNAVKLPAVPLTSTDPAALTTAFEWNVARNMELTTLSTPHMKRRGGGAVIYITSTAALFAAPHHAYGTVKAAIHRMTMNLALVLGKDNITVNAIAPGITDTDPAQFLKSDEAMLADLYRELPLGRFGKPDEMAACAIFLAGPGGGYTTGQVIAIEGGQLLEGTTATRKILFPDIFHS
jgi:NAD(P)-dependent dehydrogenase (short-subunit alcohol dehydrogenase family)